MAGGVKFTWQPRPLRWRHGRRIYIQIIRTRGKCPCCPRCSLFVVVQSRDGSVVGGSVRRQERKSMLCGSQQRALDGLCTARVVGKDSLRKPGCAGQRFKLQAQKEQVYRWSGSGALNSRAQGPSLIRGRCGAQLVLGGIPHILRICLSRTVPN